MAPTRKNKTARPSRTDGEATRKRILETAGKLFAESGFSDTSSKTIAAQAGADLASINYHFSGRGGLYQAVLAEAHRRLISVEALQEFKAADLPARDKLRKTIEGLAAGAASHQGWHARVLGREILSPTSHLTALRQNEILPKLRVIISILSEITSIPADDPALTRCAMSIAAPCVMLLVVGRSLPAIPGQILGKSSEELVSHLYHFAIGGLEAIAREYAATTHANKRLNTTRASKKSLPSKP